MNMQKKKQIVIQMNNKRFDAILDRYLLVNEECKKVITVLRDNKEMLEEMTPKELSNGLAVLSMPFRREDDTMEKSLVKAFGREMGLKINSLMSEEIEIGQLVSNMAHLAKHPPAMTYRPY